MYAPEMDVWANGQVHLSSDPLARLGGLADFAALPPLRQKVAVPGGWNGADRGEKVDRLSWTDESGIRVYSERSSGYRARHSQSELWDLDEKGSLACVSCATNFRFKPSSGSSRLIVGGATQF